MSLRVGVLYPLSGPFEAVGRFCVRAVEAALEASGGRAGPVELLTGDGSEAEIARREAERLISAGARILVGTMYSRVSVAIAQVAHERGVFYLETNAAADHVTSRERPWLVRFNTTSSAYGSTAAAVLARLAAARPDRGASVAAGWLDDPFCRSFATAALASARAAGLEVVAEERFARNGVSMARAIQAVGDAGAGFVILAAFEDAVAELHRSVRALPTGPTIIGNGAWTMRPAVDGRLIDLDGVYAVDTPSPREQSTIALGAGGRTQLEAWATRHGVAPGDHLPVDGDLAFAGACVLFERILPGAASVAPADLRASAAAIDLPRGETLLGYGVRFDERGDNRRAYAVALRWDHGVKRIVHPPELSAA